MQTPALLAAHLLAFALLPACASGPAKADDQAPAAPLLLHYAAPAQNWEREALPIGNGRLGAMLFGGIMEDRIQFNEESLWTGGPNPSGGWTPGGQDGNTFGSYQNFGEVKVAFAMEQAAKDPAARYSRDLDLRTGRHTVRFTQAGVTHTRETFTSQDAQTVVVRYGADKKGAQSGVIRLGDAHGAKAVADKDTLVCANTLGNGLRYASRLQISHAGGTVAIEGDSLRFTGCDSVTLYLAARTDYLMDETKNCRSGHNPAALAETDCGKAARRDYADLRTKAAAEMRSFMDRVSLEVGATPAETAALPLNERLSRYAGVGGAALASRGDEVNPRALDGLERTAEAHADPDLEELFYQYGRYLLASSSRPGDLPANLQGVWNASNNPAWASDYHTNINVQMNYWGAETGNLADCHRSFVDFIDAFRQSRRGAVLRDKKQFPAEGRGWTCRTSENIFGGQGWDWNIPASAWYAEHVFEHYAFSGDQAYLRQTAWPILKEVSEFWLDHLKALPDGTLVAPNGWSPEHGPREDGVMHDQQLIWDLFQNTVEAADALGDQQAFRDEVAKAQAKLAPNKIGKWGQLQEWQADRDSPTDTHRHSSHLFAVYPGRQISAAKTPDLAKAAILSLKSRSNDHEEAYGGAPATGKPFAVDTTVGDSRRSWTWPWRGAMWARLGDGDRAHLCLRGLLSYNTLPNLFCNHPPFQLDGNFGITGALPEMLVQSHAGEISLLPALPKAWPSGEVHGLRARGGVTVDLVWKDGKVVFYRLRSATPKDVKVRVEGRVKTVKTEKR